MAWTPYFGYETYKWKDLEKRYKNNKWKERKLNLIYNNEVNKYYYENAKPNEIITFLSYYDPSQSKEIECFYHNNDKIKIARDIIDEADRKRTLYLERTAGIGNIKTTDRIVFGKKEYNITEVHTLRKKDWTYLLVVVDE